MCLVQSYWSSLSVEDGSSFDEGEVSSAVGYVLQRDGLDWQSPGAVPASLPHPFSSMIFIVSSNDAAPGSPCIITQLERAGQYETGGLSYSFL